jgi:two-component system, OmpR family, sensor histidine kinase CiaH
MTLRPAVRFLRSTTARLAASYLGIIMVLSLAFSYVLYKTSAYELSRQIPPFSLFAPSPEGPGDFDYRNFFRERVAEGRGHLIGRLVVLNLLVLVVGAGLSYYLARRTLRPIEAAMEAQSRFVTDASHELRTPLTAILAGNEVALRKPKLTLTQAKQIIKSNTEDILKLKNLSDGLLSLSKQDTLPITPRPVSLQEVANEAMNRVLPVAQTRQVTIQDKTPPIMVQGELAGLVQATAVLLDNAVKYSPEKSTIYLEAQADDKNGYLHVRDKGAGIAAKDLPHIFERFYRADPARAAATSGGHGIGLSIAQKVIEQHHGHITVTSALGRGSTFTLELPLA